MFPPGKVGRGSGGERCAEATLLVAFKRAVLPLRIHLQTAIQGLGRHHGPTDVQLLFIQNQESRTQPVLGGMLLLGQIEQAGAI